MLVDFVDSILELMGISGPNDVNHGTSTPVEGNTNSAN